MRNKPSVKKNFYLYFVRKIKDEYCEVKFSHNLKTFIAIKGCTWNGSIDLFILKNMGAAIIDFRMCLPLVKCKNLMFSGFIDTLMYGFSSTGVTIYCYFGLKFNDNTCCEVICKQRYNDNDLMTTNKLPGMYFSF